MIKPRSPDAPQAYDAAHHELGALRAGIDDRIATITSAITLLDDEEFLGTAADAARTRFRGLRSNLEATRNNIERAMSLLLLAHIGETLCVSAINAARRIQPLMPEASGFIALMQLERTRIDAQVAGALALLTQEVPEPELDLLFDAAGVPLSQVHGDNLGKLSPEASALINEHNGVVLESGDGGISVLLGVHPDEMDSVQPHAINTLVAGVGSSETHALGSYLERGSTLVTNTGTPTVVWLGYSAPESLLFDAASESYAQAGADNLSFFQAALAERFPAATRTVLAHSYGTLVAVEAAKTHGLHADNLVLMGSPGVNALHVSDLHLHASDPQVFVADTYDDEIQLLHYGDFAFHGRNPASPYFGARRIPDLGGGGHAGHWDSAPLHRAIREMNALQ
ncbi:alpha/beta hydrolase [Corynebacterium lubricantis]|uniref:alpha/beta hydrolase n=1 Tax=Corynebacterium lubricantis TaxID=541095 RepID=UPI00035C5416|nr:alpha/beta hydrolase [Corynebacterium lubricantis]